MGASNISISLNRIEETGSGDAVIRIITDAIENNYSIINNAIIGDFAHGIKVEGNFATPTANSNFSVVFNNFVISGMGSFGIFFTSSLGGTPPANTYGLYEALNTNFHIGAAGPPPISPINIVFFTMDTILRPDYPAVIFPLSALDGQNLVGTADSIDEADANTLLDAAKYYWGNTTISADKLELLNSVSIEITDLDDGILGANDGSTILIDHNAANYGWFVDGSPLDATEFSDPIAQMDLLTVIMHEMGHVLGLNDVTYDAANPQIMSDHLDVGVRYLPPQNIVNVEVHLSQSELAAIMDAAVQRWVDAGITAEQAAILSNVTYEVSDLSLLRLAEVDGMHITVDADAGGTGWFVDQSPMDNVEYAYFDGQYHLTSSEASDAYGQYDLLSAMTHELGHLIGLEDSLTANDVMNGVLNPGERYLPSAINVAQSGEYVDGISSLDEAVIRVSNLQTDEILIVEIHATIKDVVSADLEILTNQASFMSDSFMFPILTNPVETAVIVAPLIEFNKDATLIVGPGGIVTYTFEITNTGNQETADLVISDSAPEFLTFDPDNSSDGWMDINMDGTDLQFNLDAVNVGDPQTVSLVFNVDDFIEQAGIINNQAELTFTTGGVVINLDAEASTTLDPTLLNVDFLKTGPQTPVDPGENVTYTFTIENTGNTEIVGINIEESTPQFLTFNQIESNNLNLGWMDNAGTITFNLDPLAKDATATVQIVFTVDSVIETQQIVTNMGKLTVDNKPFDVDSNEVMTTILPTVLSADIAKAASATTIVPGQDITYTFTVTNTGNAQLDNLNIIEMIPDFGNFTFNQTLNTGWVHSGGGNFQYNIATLNEGAIVTPMLVLTLNDSVAFGFEDVINQATLNLGTSLLNESDPITTIINANPLYSIIKSPDGETVEPGDTIIYTFTVENVGNQDAINLSINEINPDIDHLTFEAASSTNGSDPNGWQDISMMMDGSEFLFEIAELNVGASQAQVINIAFKVNDSVQEGFEQVQNFGTLNFAEGSMNSNTVTTSIEALPAYEFTKMADVMSVVPGANVTYTFTVKNVGDQVGTNIVINESTPEHFSFVSGAGWTETSLGSGDYQFDVSGVVPGKLAVGETAMASIVFKLDDVVLHGFDNVLNQGLLTFPDDPMSQPSNVETVMINAAPEYAFSKDGPMSVNAGDMITYTFSVENTGNRHSLDVTINDSVPDYFTFLDDPLLSTPGWMDDGNNNFTYHINALTVNNPADIVTITFKVDDILDAGVENVINQPTLTINEDPGFVPAAAVNTTLIAEPKYTITKIPLSSSVQPGGDIIYKLVIENTGNQHALDVDINEVLPTSPTSGLTLFSFNPDNSSDGWVPNGGDIKFHFNELNVDGRHELLIAFTLVDVVPAGVEMANNQVSLTFDEIPGLNIISPIIPVNIVASPDFLFSKTDSGVAVIPGDTITYTFTVENVGNQEAVDVNIIDTTPALLSFNPGASDMGWVANVDGSIITYNLTDVNVGDVHTVQIVFNVPTNFPTGTAGVVNNASLVATSVANGGINFDAPGINTTASDTTRIVQGNNILLDRLPQDYYDLGRYAPLPDFQHDAHGGQLISLNLFNLNMNLHGAGQESRYDPLLGPRDFMNERIGTVHHAHWPSIHELLLSDTARYFPGISPYADALPEHQLLKSQVGAMSGEVVGEPGNEPAKDVKENPVVDAQNDAIGTEITGAMIDAMNPEGVNDNNVSYQTFSKQLRIASSDFDERKDAFARALKDCA